MRPDRGAASIGDHHADVAAPAQTLTTIEQHPNTFSKL